MAKERDDAIDLVRQRLGAAELERALDEGRRLSLDEAFGLAVGRPVPTEVAELGQAP
jgi:hypothetical protein